jgi:Tannase and feruloyl esterase
MKATILLLLAIAGGASAQSPCDQVKSLSLPYTTFSAVESVAAGPYKAPAQNADGGGRAGGSVDRTRPLCAYPQVAVYRGTGSINDASNFVCRLP